jgi:epoxyqueuosine reductase
MSRQPAVGKAHRGGRATGISSISTTTIAGEADVMVSKLRFIEYLEKNGCYGSVVSINHLEELGAEIRSLHEKGLLDDRIYNHTSVDKPFHTPRLPRNLPGAKSIIVVATPQPIIRTTFHLAHKSIHLVVPPTYYDADKVAGHARRLLAQAFKPRSYRIIRAYLPLKTLAVRSGLALYGRNNITYIPKYGSFYRLTAFYSDHDSPIDYWQEKKALPLCERCKACINACPTKAIREDRFLVRAEICLTYLNERNSEVKFPKWVKASAHNALIGCLRCQRACPYDKAVANWYENRGEFSEDETEYLLRGKFSGEKAAKMEKKLKRLGLDLTSFPRNLKTLLDSQNLLFQ